MSLSLCLSLVSALGLGSFASASASAPVAWASLSQESPFPASTALAEGVSPEALAGLDALVQSLVDEGDVVGAELLVIKNGRSILHEAYGWRDRESDLAMETGSVFCVRSMTKPVVGAAILMLIDDDLLELDDHVAKFLPSFDVEGLRDITVEHLLTHTSGLPMSTLIGRDLHDLHGIRAVADLGAGEELEFDPGGAFNYSDQGTDTLTSLIEIVSGVPPDEFVRTRLLEPLGMDESACVMTEGHPLRPRTCSKYAGSRDRWTRFWSPEDPPLFPFFLGSQGLYSTLTDYARFMEFWRLKGRVGRDRLLAPRYVRRALAPGPYPLGGSTGLPGMRTDYGYLMQLWTEPGEEVDDEREVVAFGHTGSDGTHAWVFPKQKAMVLYFTQSRGTTSGLRVEEALGDLLFGVPFDANQAAPPFEQYLGYYWEGENDLYRAIVRDGEDLALEIMGRAVVPLTYVGNDRWKLRPDPSKVIAFDRSETGEVTGYHIGDHQEFRFDPAADLPEARELAARVAAVHRLDLIESLGPIRMNGALDIAKVGVTGTFSTLLAWPGNFRVDSLIAEMEEHVSFDGEQVMYSSTNEPAAALEGARAESARVDSPFARFGDWHRWYPELQVIQRFERGDREMVLVRAGGTSAPALTLFVDEATGRVVHLDRVVDAGAMGRIGQSVDYSDFRDVSGMLLPFRAEITVANPMIGAIVTTIEEVELGIGLPDDPFDL